MNILITGGGGFLAGHIGDYLANTHMVFAPTKQQLDCTDSQMMNAFFNNHSIDIVIHTALSGRENLFDEDPIWLVNALLMWRNLFNNRHRFKRLIHFGTAYELDLNVSNKNIDARNILKYLPTPSYGYAKNIIARLCYQTDNFFNLRLFGLYHYTEKPQRFFKKLFHSDVFEISEDRIFDYFNLEDIFPVLQLIIQDANINKDFNLVYSEKLTLSQQANMFCESTGISPQLHIGKKGKELSGNGMYLKSLNLKLQGLQAGFHNYRKLTVS